MNSSTSCALLDEELVKLTSSKTDVVLQRCDKDIRNKGAILVLVCNFLVTSVFYYTSFKSVANSRKVLHNVL